MKILWQFIVTAAVLLLIARFLPGITIEGTESLLIFALVFSLINIFLRPVLKVVTFPITLITLGLFSFVLNALLFLLAASFVDGVVVDGFLIALIASLILSIVNSFLAPK